MLPLEICNLSVVMRDADMPDDLLANLLTGAHRLDDLDAGALAFGIMFGADEHVRECSRTSRNRNPQLPLGALLCPPGSQGLKLNKKTPDKPTKPTNSGTCRVKTKKRDPKAAFFRKNLCIAD